MPALIDSAAALADQLRAWRRDFHQHPELGFNEVRTARIVAAELGKLGLDVQTGVGKTGVVGLLAGAFDGPTVMLRADMDALPIQEETGADYASTTPNTMHACGHDGHMAIGLGVAHLLAARRDRMHGRVKFIFQPAEEPMGGAQAMIADGALENPRPDVAFGLHLWNPLPVGQVAVTTGPIMAGADTFTIHLQGQGGHAASPHETRDPVVAAGQIIAALQSVVSRNIDPLDSAVLSVTSLQAGTAGNAIPMTARLEGTLRTFTPRARTVALERLRDIAEGISAALGCTATVEGCQEAPPVVNDATALEILRQAIAPLFAPDALRADFRTMASEDMALFLKEVPGCYLLLGASNAARHLDYPHHQPRFDFDEAILPQGVALLASAAAAYVLPDGDSPTHAR
jgi:amidohydrolase